LELSEDRECHRSPSGMYSVTKATVFWNTQAPRNCRDSQGVTGRNMQDRIRGSSRHTLRQTDSADSPFWRYLTGLGAFFFLSVLHTTCCALVFYVHGGDGDMQEGWRNADRRDVAVVQELE